LGHQLTLIISALAYDYLENLNAGHSSTAVVCVFCDYTEKDAQTPAALLGSIWRQLFDTNMHIPQDISELYQKCVDEGATPTCQQISDLLPPLFASRQVYIIVDALDECAEEPGREHRSLFLQHLLNLQLLYHVNLLFTSRPNDDILALFTPDGSVPIRARESDIALYIKSRLKDERRLRTNIRKDPSLETEVTSTIIRKSQDMYGSSPVTALIV
jgi:hypothetical protein